MQTIAAKEGWRTLYKGYATVTQIAPAQALYMATYQTSKKYLPGNQSIDRSQSHSLPSDSFCYSGWKIRVSHSAEDIPELLEFFSMTC
jgi:hypothetical protein